MELENFLAVIGLSILAFASVGIYVVKAYIYLFVPKAKGAKAEILYEWVLTEERDDYYAHPKLGWLASLGKKLSKDFGFSKTLIGLFINVKYEDGKIGNLKISKKLYNKIQNLKFIGDDNLHSVYFKIGRWSQQSYAVSIK